MPLPPIHINLHKRLWLFLVHLFNSTQHHLYSPTGNKNCADSKHATRGHLICYLTAICIFLIQANVQASSHIDFTRDILPILSDHCFQCHGPDESHRKSGLRLDTESGSRMDLGGYAAIEPGCSDCSVLISRIQSQDPEEQMPPPEANKALTETQKNLLRQWVDAGAEYEGHWAWTPPRREALPRLTQHSDWPRNEVDHFMLQRLLDENLTPSPEADRTTLIRRVTLDLTGLPPTLAEVDAFLADDSPDAFEKVVDRLLDSPHYGERMAVDWLDAARYADTNGYQVDRDREMFAWRDWVIDAFNQNMPFDVFTVEQLAGDLLPDPTLQQRIATGFHRNHMMNEEGGIIPEEFLAEYCSDRVETTMTIWLGQTFICARCHDHKYDPFSQRDYYSIYAFFHNVSEQGRGNYGAPIQRNNPPMIQLPSPEQESTRALAQAELGKAEQLLANTPEDSDQRETLKKRVDDLKKKADLADLAIPTALVMDELPEPRPTYILVRGSYDRQGQQVYPDTPTSLPPMDEDLPRNRLGLARWLMDPENPLTARVTVNRLWQSVFGTGIVPTPEDFGTRGERPSHPALLDWLAVELVESGWNIKAMMRLLTTSATYRQSSHTRQELLEHDPENRLLARSSRHRLQAEFLRDQALAASGLLSLRIGGPSVKPYHPPGLYEQVVAGSSANTYVQDKGEDLFRRTMYTYWKRSVPHPAMLTFDVPFRESCAVRRSRTNTPMQALNLMNDTTYVEAARHLASRMLEAPVPTLDARLAHGFRLVLARPPSTEELNYLTKAVERSLNEFANAPDQANALLSTGESGEINSNMEHDPADWAAHTIAASIILNLDETVTRE